MMKGLSVWNEKLDYEVDVTAGLWRDALREWDDLMTVGEHVDLIIGVDGKPLVIPRDAALYSGEWYVNVDGLYTYLKLTDQRCCTAPTQITTLINHMADDVVERIIAIMSVIGEGIVESRRSRENRDNWYMEYVDINHRRVVIRVLTPRATDSKLHACECAVARHKYDIVHNAQYIADNFGTPANGRVEGIVIL